MALVLTEAGIPGTTELFGTVRISADLDPERAEYAILVRGDMTGMGLGIVWQNIGPCSSPRSSDTEQRGRRWFQRGRASG